MFKRISSFFTVSALLVVPAIVLAAPVDFGAPPTVSTTPIADAAGFILGLIGKVLDIVWIFFIAFAVIMFIVAGFQFLAAQGEPDGLGKARKSVLWGAIGVIVGVAALSIPFVIRNVLGL